MPGEWASTLRQLYSHLDRNDKKLDLLRYIDKDMPDPNRPLIETIAFVTRRLADMVGSKLAYVYVFDGQRFRRVPDLSGNHSPAGECGELTPEELGWKGYRERDWQRRVIPKDELGPHLTKLFPSSEAIVALPLIVRREKCFGIVLLDSREALEKSALVNDLEIKEFTEDVGRQLQNAIELRDSVERSNLQSELASAFFENAHDPIRCFDELAKKVVGFLPHFGPLAIDPVPEVQILLYEERGNTLRIVGSTGPEQRITRVRVNDSVSGRVITDPQLPHYVVDPHDDPLYKFYLGRKQNKQMFHELVVPIKWVKDMGKEMETIGVLNLESEIPNAFSQVHIQSMRELCHPHGNPSIAPMVNALSTSMLFAQAQEMSSLSALNKHLQGFSRVLRHGTATPFSTIGTNLTILERELHEETNGLEENAKLAHVAFEKLSRTIDTYVEDISGFLKFTKRSLRSMIDRAIRMSADDLKAKDIRVTLLMPEDIEVYSSLLLTQHIHDLINNAVMSIEERLQKKPAVPGLIEIKAEPEPEPLERQEKELNKWCRVTITDNGMGAPPEVLQQIGHPKFTTRAEKGGSGFGVFGAKSYVDAVHGVWLEPESKKGEFFRVQFLLQIYDPRIHGSDPDLAPP